MPATPTSKGYFELFDDLAMDNIASAAANGVRWLESSDAGNTAITLDITSASAGRFEGATDTTDDDMIEMAMEAFIARAQDGPIICESRFMVTAVTTVAMNFGLNDDALEDSNTLPMELATTTFTSNASEWVGFVYDIDATNDDWHAFWVDDDSDASEPIANLRFTGFAPVASQMDVLRLEVTDRGAGSQCQTRWHAQTGATQPATYVKATNSGITAAGTIDRDAYFTPHLGMENRAVAAHTFTVDYVYLMCGRA